jgi:hypothetical protein
MGGGGPESIARPSHRPATAWRRGTGAALLALLLAACTPPVRGTSGAVPALYVANGLDGTVTRLDSAGGRVLGPPLPAGSPPAWSTASSRRRAGPWSASPPCPTPPTSGPSCAPSPASTPAGRAPRWTASFSLPDGTALQERAMQKVRGGERGGTSAVALCPACGVAGQKRLR